MELLLLEEIGKKIVCTVHSKFDEIDLIANIVFSTRKILIVTLTTYKYYDSLSDTIHNIPTHLCHVK